jgi:hypothetical protein
VDKGGRKKHRKGEELRLMLNDMKIIDRVTYEVMLGIGYKSENILLKDMLQDK